MEIHYYREYSYRLGRFMEFKTYGKRGKICLAFPSQNGRFYDFEDFGMPDTMRPWIESGEIMLVTCDGIDQETWSFSAGNPRERLQQQERWFSYVTDELVWSVLQKNETPEKARVRKLMTTGCSMGGFHAANAFFRRPDLFDTVISLSGCYNGYLFFEHSDDPLVYENSPAVFLKGMPEDHPYMSLYRASNIILCVGQGAWEDELLASTREMDAVLRNRNIPAFVDYWGYDVNHDWVWWRRQLPYFLGRVPGIRQVNP
ncbi:MAG: esterase [Lachnospiraceae bacterium]|nr:esterase [Lachnospiraceae bacterium]